MLRMRKSLQEFPAEVFSAKEASLSWEKDFGVRLKPDMVYVRTRAISARVNQNFDAWPSSELKKAYRTFVGRPVFVNHVNEDPSRTRGIIRSSRWVSKGDDKYIELLIEVDPHAFPKLASVIEKGWLDGVSMGCTSEFSVCSVCGHHSYSLTDMCPHVASMKGSTLNVDGEDQLIYEECHGLSFYEISFVFDPADETALFQGVLHTPPKSSLGLTVRSDEPKVPYGVDTLETPDDGLGSDEEEVVFQLSLRPVDDDDVPDFLSLREDK